MLKSERAGCAYESVRLPNSVLSNNLVSASLKSTALASEEVVMGAMSLKQVSLVQLPFDHRDTFSTDRALDLPTNAIKGPHKALALPLCSFFFGDNHEISITELTCCLPLRILVVARVRGPLHIH